MLRIMGYFCEMEPEDSTEGQTSPINSHPLAYWVDSTFPVGEDVVECVLKISMATAPNQMARELFRAGLSKKQVVSVLLYGANLSLPAVIRAMHKSLFLEKFDLVELVEILCAPYPRGFGVPLKEAILGIQIGVRLSLKESKAIARDADKRIRSEGHIPNWLLYTVGVLTLIIMTITIIAWGVNVIHLIVKWFSRLFF